MAIDTETKRRSMLGMGLPFLVVMPVPDGNIDSLDRLHLMGLPAIHAPALAVFKAVLRGKLSSEPMLISRLIAMTKRTFILAIIILLFL